MKKKCYIYTRVSTAIQVEGYSLEAQKAELHRYASYNDLDTVMLEYREEASEVDMTFSE